MAEADRKLSNGNSRIDFKTDPGALPALEDFVRRPRRHADHGRRRERAACSSGYQLKLNSYDLGVDIELADAVQRLRFEHPEVRVGASLTSRQGPRVLRRREHPHAGRRRRTPTR